MEMINLEQIKITNPYLRTKTDIDLLKKSIEAVGLINPLTINEKDELLAGGRRYMAAKELGFKEVAVKRVSLSQMEQELVSIDENLVRTPLNKLELEQCLNRGREIYESLNPAANKVDISVKNLTAAEKKLEKEREENDTTSFAAIASEKIGLSKSVIKNAIKRDAQSSKVIKKARGAGEISATQVNEIIKLSQEDQETLLPYIKEKSVKAVRKIVQTARKEGLDSAIQSSLNENDLPREFSQLELMVQRCNKHLSKILIENIDIESESIEDLLLQVEKLQEKTQSFLELYSSSTTFVGTKKSEFNEVSSLQ